MSPRLFGYRLGKEAPSEDAPTPESPFARLQWQKDRMLLDDLVFQLEHYRSDDWDLGDQCFRFYKTRELVDQYARFWAQRPGYRPDHVFELGIWDGGSVAFWSECLRPSKHVAIDIQQKQDSDYFRRYVAARGRAGRIATYWGVDQADRPQLLDIASREFTAPLDLVVDDASHLYEPTRRSFETLFPLLRPGGLYIVEDWAWEHWPDFGVPGHVWSNETSLTRLVCELVEAAGSDVRLIANLTVFGGFVVIERGERPAAEIGELDLEARIVRRRPSVTAR